jgi:hypothetical protein
MATIITTGHWKRQMDLRFYFYWDGIAGRLRALWLRKDVYLVTLPTPMLSPMFVRPRTEAGRASVATGIPLRRQMLMHHRRTR